MVWGTTRFRSRTATTPKFEALQKCEAVQCDQPASAISQLVFCRDPKGTIDRSQRSDGELREDNESLAGGGGHSTRAFRQPTVAATQSVPVY